MKMTFSEFAQTLYPYLGNGDTKAQFVITLTNKIMTKPGASRKDGTCQNPIINKDDRTLQYYFSGGRSISRKDAQVIVANHKKIRFEEFINEYSDDTLRCINRALIEKGILDPTKVSRSALQNAASVSATLLTTEALVVEIEDKKKQDERDVY